MDSSYLVGCLLNAFLSYTATMLNIVTIHAIRKTPSLSKNLKTLLLSLAVSDLGVGLVAQPLFVARRIMESQLNNETSKTYNAIKITFFISANLVGFATLFLVIILCAERFIAIHYYLRYRKLVTHKRVVALVVSTWVLSGLFSLTNIWIPRSIMFVVFGITQLACIIAATFFSIKIYLSVRLHVNQIQVLQIQHAPQNAQMVNVQRMRKFATMSVYVCLFLTVCYLPNICTLFAIAFTSRPSTGIMHLKTYAGTLVFLNSSLNPVIYCWKMKHIRHTIIGFIRNAFTKQN
ncbi:unnamed protein product [Porites evermanni]|uniref:G-protein coupled receptors family 1 profile domain-containing protein n=1 Tax=Porites evermanni TaxID=104178 RepID=A0ABN8MAB2_9CNID|nr:unnamed protein product [Porites evermanni]